MEENAFEDYVSKGLAKKVGSLPSEGDGAVYHLPYYSLLERERKITVGRRFGVEARHLNGWTDLCWGIERVIILPDIKYNSRAEEFRVPLSDSGLSGYIRLSSNWRDIPYIIETNDFSKVTGIKGEIDSEGIDIGIPLERAVELILSIATGKQ